MCVCVCVLLHFRGQRAQGAPLLAQRLVKLRAEFREVLRVDDAQSIYHLVNLGFRRLLPTPLLLFLAATDGEPFKNLFLLRDRPSMCGTLQIWRHPRR